MSRLSRYAIVARLSLRMLISRESMKAITYWFTTHANFAHVAIRSYLAISSLAARCTLLSWQSRRAFGSWLANGTSTTVEARWTFEAWMTGCAFAAAVALRCAKYRCFDRSQNAPVSPALQRGQRSRSLLAHPLDLMGPCCQCDQDVL